MPRNLCNCPNCQTDNCPAATDYAETVATLEASKRSEISCIEWMDALAQRCERRAEILLDYYGPGSSMYQEATTWEELSKDIRSYMESASNDKS